ncbi:GNAT family N-acetyltransferase [Rhizobium sp. ARZ01]|uniref:GNAT family N-acetyltransferase n=1 Tax=Rhizobium sp. ARZ01 TaxID=2769313 RepID=UPI00177B5F75|nr:GNAT family N-acetyltransferase [Rhizobium sp. ARZ01]MBD9375558.1 GNAT family N-acetyltransferase [Rhizobium sp. ARZ01]
MTFPAYRSLLDGAPGHDIFVASQGTELCGLALWRESEEGGRRLLSIFTASVWRRRGVARALLRQAQETYRFAGAGKLAAFWSDSLPGAEPFSRLLASLGWSIPALDCVRISANAQQTKIWSDSRRMERMTIRPGIEFREFGAVSAAERTEIDRLLEAEGVPARWRPFDPLENVNQQLSLLMYRNTHLDGWIVVQDSAPSEVWFYSLYNRGLSASAGALMPLLVEVCRRHHAAFGPTGRWRYNTGPDHPGMAAFLDRYAEEFADFHDRHLYSTFTPTGAPSATV